jgi:hypothetical protein
VAGGKLDGAGTAKIHTLEDATAQLQRVHSLVEKYALAVKQNQQANVFVLQIKRALEPMVGMLKAQFGLIADQVTAVILSSSRGGGDQARIRTLREGVGQLRQAMEIAERKVKEQHTTE